MNAPLEPVPGRVPPSDLDAEAAVLSASLLDAEALDVVREILLPSEMYAGANRWILEAAFALQDLRRPVDIVGVAGWLRDQGRLDQIGGTPYLAQISDATPAVSHVADHAQRVKEKARLRSVISVCQKYAAEGYGDVGDVPDWLERVEKEIADASVDPRQVITSMSYGDAMKVAYDNMVDAARRGATMVGYRTGFDEMDNHVGGLASGDLWIVGGYPGVGKTSWVKQASETVAVQKTKKGARVGVAFFSLEMEKGQLMSRALARRSEIEFRNVRVGRLQPAQWRRAADEGSIAKKVAMELDDDKDLTPHRMRRKARRHLTTLRNKFGSDLEYGAIVVDYIQLIGANQPTKNRAEELGTIVKQLKQIGQEFGCAVIALSSLNRPDTKAKPKSPGMAALRESGALEFAADVILMVHRDDPFKDKGQAHDNEAELTIVKGRNSGNSRHECQFDGRFTAFYPKDHVLLASPQQEFDTTRDWRDSP